ncbi:DNA repair protein RecO [Striga asiatica]|uniref:DNA repair protein RecO n=1 Tax=Striga asiatica TaxID=4170 RepID=A0A5A7QJ20_STRAF|nr:DNA repair protein RecO [Striga asiatica]
MPLPESLAQTSHRRVVAALLVHHADVSLILKVYGDVNLEYSCRERKKLNCGWIDVLVVVVVLFVEEERKKSGKDHLGFESLPLLRNVDSEKNDLGAEKSKYS